MNPAGNPLRKKLAAGDAVLGVGVRLGTSVEIAPLMASVGYDWLFIDMEHGTMSVEAAAQISMTALGLGITPIVRVPAGEFSMATRVLDGGAWGIVVPHINSVADAKHAVTQLKFPPLGERSSGPPTPQLNYMPVATGVPRFNTEMLIIGMIETPEAVENAAAIAAVPGIDVLLVGTNDLALTMGIPGQLTDPRIFAAYDKVIAACKAHGKWPGAGGVYEDDLIRNNIDRGMRLIIAGGDAIFMMAAARQRYAALRK